jgi:hypothetical protein
MNAIASGTLPVMPVSASLNPGGIPAPDWSPTRIADASRCASITWPGVAPGGASTLGTPMPKRRMLVAWTRHTSCLSSHAPYAGRSRDRPVQFAPSRSCAYQTNRPAGMSCAPTTSWLMEATVPSLFTVISPMVCGIRSPKLISRAWLLRISYRRSNGMKPCTSESRA